MVVKVVVKMKTKEFNQFLGELGITLDDYLTNDQFKKVVRFLQDRAFDRFKRKVTNG